MCNDIFSKHQQQDKTTIVANSLCLCFLGSNNPSCSSITLTLSLYFRKQQLLQRPDPIHSILVFQEAIALAATHSIPVFLGSNSSCIQFPDPTHSILVFQEAIALAAPRSPHPPSTTLIIPAAVATTQQQPQLHRNIPHIQILFAKQY